jgi:formamidopyrimidine-DNA glycosylase
VKQFVMDAKRVVGVGNIYASESLFRAGIDPRARAGRIPLQKYEKLAAAIKATLRAAIKAGGSSLRDFVGADGGEGYFQNRTLVYDRADMQCRRCRTPIRRIVQGARATYFCPSCQS